MRISLAALLLLLALGLAGRAVALEWSSEVLVGGDDDFDDTSASVTATSDGLVWAVWQGGDPEDIFYSVDAGGGWSERMTIAEPDANEDFSPRISAGLSGAPWVLWKKNNAGTYKLLVTRFDGGCWLEPVVVRTGASRYDTYDIHVVSDVDVWIVTSTTEPPWEARVLLTYHWDGTEWAGPFPAGFSESNDWGGYVSVASDGVPWLVWGAEGHAPSGDAVACSRFAGGVWSEPEIIDDSPGSVFGGQIGFDESGTPVVVWLGDSQTLSDNVKYSTWENGEWATPADVNEVDEYPDTQGFVRLGGSAAGDLWVVWVSSILGDLWSTRVTACNWQDGEWSSEETVSDTTVMHKFEQAPDVAVLPSGEVVVAWKSYIEVFPYDYDIRATRSITLTPVDYCCLEASVCDVGARLSWHAAASDVGPFTVWRAENTTGAAIPEGTSITATAAPLSGPCSVPVAATSWVDATASRGQSYNYWVEWCRSSNSVVLGPVALDIPASLPRAPLELLSISPNPARGQCRVSLYVRQEGTIAGVVHDAAGREVARIGEGGDHPATTQDSPLLLVWDGTDSGGRRVAAGVYFIRLLHNGRRVPGALGRVVVLE